MNRKFRVLKTDEELHAYRDGFMANIQRGPDARTSEIPMEYLRASTVTGVFENEGTIHEKMVAGYVVGNQLPFRLFNFVPPEARPNLVPPWGGTWDDCAEITCAWKTADVSPIFMSAILWPRVDMEVLASGKKVLLGHNQNAALDKFYTKAGPQTVYKGLSSFGLHSHLFAYNRPQMVLCLWMVLFLETPRRIVVQAFRRVAGLFR